MLFTQSLRKNYQFLHVYRGGQSAANKYLALYTRKNGLDFNRLGVSVSKKVGKSVVRSRVKRLIKESYRLGEPIVCRGCDFVIVARAAAGTLPDYDAFRIISQSLMHLLNKQKLIISRDETNTH